MHCHDYPIYYLSISQLLSKVWYSSDNNSSIRSLQQNSEINFTYLLCFIVLVTNASNMSNFPLIIDCYYLNKYTFAQDRSNVITHPSITIKMLRGNRTLTLTLLLLCLITVNSQFLRRTTLQGKYFYSFNFWYCRAVNGVQYNDWTITGITFYDQILYSNFNYYYTTNINSISSGPSTFGYTLNVQLKSFWQYGIQFGIIDNAVNRYSNSLVSYSITFLLFALPSTSPFSVQTLTTMIYNLIGNSYYTLSTTTFPQQFPLPPTLTQTCYYDKTRKIQDFIRLLPSITQINIDIPEYINLTSSSNWVYPWNANTKSLNFTFAVTSYYSQAHFVAIDVIAVCPNSYVFSDAGISMAITGNNWFQFQANTMGQTAYRTVQLEYPITSELGLMLGQAITGISLHYQKFNSLIAASNTTTPLLQLSFNITPVFDVKGQTTGYFGNISLLSVMPWKNYGFIWFIGSLGNCLNNLSPYNSTHCFCNPALNLTYDPLYSLYLCRPACFFGYFFDYTFGICVSCQQRYSFLCSTCNSTICFNCTNGLTYYLQSTTVLCLNCTKLFGVGCLFCSNTQCITCSQNLIVNSTSNCSCSGPDRYPFNSSCVLCSVQFSYCQNCTISRCTGCIISFILTNGTCSCVAPSILLSGVCYSCQDLYGWGCASCTASGCLNCSLGTYFNASNNSCASCWSVYDQYCTICNSSLCLACQPNFKLVSNRCFCPSPTFAIINKTCQPCSNQPGCFQCNSTACLLCSANFTLVNNSCICPPGTYFDLTSCLPCANSFSNCQNCLLKQCLSCLGQYQLTNGYCVCSIDRYITGGQCVLCSKEVGCLSCSGPSVCTFCSQGFSLVNGSCLCGAGGLLEVDMCLSCKNVYGSGCYRCNSSICLSCQYNFVLNGTNCICPANYYALTLGSCESCKDSYPFCQVCNNFTCLQCQTNFKYLNSTCICSGDRYQTLLQTCQFCSVTFPNCLSCQWKGCEICYQNFTLINGVCQCLAPRVIVTMIGVKRCMGCSATGSAEHCSLVAKGQYYQSGDILYFWLTYNHPIQSIQYLLGIQYNLVIEIDGKQTNFRYNQQTNIFEVDLNRIHGQALVNIVIPAKEYIKSGKFYLSNDPSSFTVNEVDSLLVTEEFIVSFLTARNYALVGLLVLSLGVFNRLFENSNLLLVMCYTQANLPNTLGRMLNGLNWKGIYNPIALDVPILDPMIEDNNIRATLFGLNISMINISMQLYLAGLISICLCGYVRGYLKSKRQAHRHIAFRNIMQFSLQYMLQNILCIHSLLAFPAIVQIKAFTEKGISNLSETSIVNLSFSVFLVIVPFCLYVIYFFHFSPRSRRYSVLYSEMQSEKALVVIFHFLSALRPYFITIIVLYVPSPASLQLILAYNSLYIALMMIGIFFKLTKLNYLLLLLKTIGFIYENVVLLYNGQDSVFLRVGAYIVLGIITLQFLQIVVKLITLILRNKGVIDDNYVPVEHDPNDIQAQHTQRRKKLTVHMLQFITRAKNELSQILAKRKKRQ